MASIESKKYILTASQKKDIKCYAADLEEHYIQFYSNRYIRTENDFCVIFELPEILSEPLIAQIKFYVSSEGCCSRIGTYTSSPVIVGIISYFNRCLRKVIRGYIQAPLSTFKMCSNCKIHKKNVKKCTCNATAYCSTTCQKADWNRHKTLCKRLRSIDTARDVHCDPTAHDVPCGPCDPTAHDVPCGPCDPTVT